MVFSHLDDFTQNITHSWLSIVLDFLVCWDLSRNLWRGPGQILVVSLQRIEDLLPSRFGATGHRLWGLQHCGDSLLWMISEYGWRAPKVLQELANQLLNAIFVADFLGSRPCSQRRRNSKIKIHYFLFYFIWNTDST